MLKYSFGLLATVLVFLSSCRDSVEPNIPYSEFDTGAYLRTIARTSTTFNFFNLGASNFALTLEAVDIEDGATVENVEIRVRHRRLIPGVGLSFTPANDVLVKTLQKTDFAPNDQSRFLRTSFVVTAAEAIAAVGLTEAEIEGGDVFEFRLVLNDKFGRSFSTNNVTTNVAGAPFYASPFQYNVSVICPSDLAGTYAFDALETFCGDTFSGSTTWTAVAATPGSYTVSDGTFGAWQSCYPDTWGNGNVRIADACGRLTMSGTDKYGDSYSMTVISSTPEVLTFEWVNTYGEFGTVAVKSNAGKPWPQFR
ncbi:hypothetical protein [Algoriphagus boritolerans]|uniref:DUF1735 domain-containing protein n=2 Tax=Algoriphagus TaxID=246875 RepID=A0A1H5USK1_9BACT|nr:hypothetical protein [Algoriphagus boritolerans]SEF77398.1 hypothetical protein SAMN03080598_01325 [Algoriphagus boritolerans DSM 17298 = JCM 18970]